jgi:hypothetical protein
MPSRRCSLPTSVMTIVSPDPSFLLGDGHRRSGGCDAVAMAITPMRDPWRQAGDGHQLA